MRETIFISPNHHNTDNYGLPSAISVHISRGKPGHLANVWDIEPVSVSGEMLAQNLGLAVGFGAAANLIRSEPNIDSLVLNIPGPVHLGWQSLAALFSTLSGIDLQVNSDFSMDIPVPTATGDVYLVSGGKDSLFALEQRRRRQGIGSLSGKPGIYLGAGCELNWRQEFRQVCRVVEAFKLELTHVRLYRQPVSNKAELRFGNRGVWRELAGLTLARCLGNHIVTGINNDPLARLEVITPHAVDYFGNLIPTVRAMEEILGATIETVPGEFEVYRVMREHWLFDQAGSCMSPTCSKSLCSKCRTFSIYEKILGEERLQPEDVEFIHSNRYLGDAALLPMYPMPELNASQSCGNINEGG